MDYWRILWVECFAIVASYLILTMPAASATSVRIYNSASPGSPLATISYNPGSAVDTDVVIDPPWTSPDVRLNFSNSSTAVSLESVFVYRCRGKSPSECVASVSPDSSVGNFGGTFPWASLVSQTTSYPQVGNLLVMARVNREGKLSWVGFWIRITRDSEQSFDVSEDDLSLMSIYVDDIGKVNTIKEFINSNQMIPVNTDWISRIVFESAASLYEILFDEPEAVEGGEISGNEVSDTSKNYSFIFPSASQVMNPIVLYSSPSYICGNEQCDGANGENSENCCLDCPCSTGYYCDSSMGCRAESGITLQVYGSFQPGVSNCYESHGIEVPLEVKNAPSGMTVVSSWYRLMGEQYSTTCTHVSGNLYSCPITVPSMPDCTEGVYMLGPNKAGMEISYLDGSESKSRIIEADLPYINIGSFSCGESGCERDIGESEGSCCYDCGCMSGYCDYWSGGSPIDATCRQDPDGDDIYAASVDPAHFSSFSSTGETVNMNVVVGNAPRSLEVTGVSCAMGCLVGSEVCSASCSVSCSEVSSSDPTKYNSSCTLSISIADYDTGNDYVLSPDLTFGFRYNNGSSAVLTKSITKTLNQISVGANWCGDGICTGNENQESCCFDCSCPEGQYCDTRNINGPIQGDSCRSLSGIELVIDSVGDLVLEDSMSEHIIPIEGHIDNAPSGISVSGTCSLSRDPEIECLVYCQATKEGDTGAGVDCDIHIAPIDYVTTGQPYYDPGSRKLTLSSNSYEITVTYNDGNVKRNDVYSKLLGTVEISVVSHCGEGGCEESLGENQANCCRDCGCSDYGDDHFCYTGRKLVGECLDNSSILISVEGFKPSPAVCIIGYIGGPCRFLEPTEASLVVTNAPEGVSIIDASYIVEGQEKEVMECEDGEDNGEFVCPVVPGDLGSSEGVENRSIEIVTALSYYIGELEVTQNASAITTIMISREKSSALISCEGEIERIQQQVDSLESNQGSYDSYSMIMYIIAVILMVLFIYCIICSCYPTSICPSTTTAAGVGESSVPEGGTISYGACGTECVPIITSAMQMFMFASSLDQKSQDAELQKKTLTQQMEMKRQICSSESFGELAGATEGMMSIPGFG